MKKLAQFVLVAASGCLASGGDTGREDKELSGLVTPPKHELPLPAIALSSPKRWLSLVAQEYPRAAGDIGPHKFSGNSTLVLTQEGAAEPTRTLAVESVISYQDPTHFVATVDNDQEHGAHFIAAGEFAFIRARYGKYHKRRHYGETELAKTLTRASTDAIAYLTPFATQLQAKKTGEVPCGKSTCVTVAFTATSGRLQKTDVAWAQGAQLSSLTASASIDTKTGFPFEMKVEAAALLVREGSPWRLTVAAAHSIAPGPQEIKLPSADDWLETHRRKRDVADRNKLLKGLAPPVGPQ